MQSNQPNMDLNTNSLPGSFDSVVLPAAKPAAAETMAAAERMAESVKVLSAQKPRNCVEIWGVPFDVVTLTESIDRIGDLIARGEPSYVITANLNYVMLHGQRDDMKPVTDDADLIVATASQSFCAANCLTRNCQSELLVAR